ncbi:hypothetical protein [Bosea minatitlanensis]|jgi:hypothetical protein|uniref:GNAT family N-acetyltransferase n=1 Tax=Bosea minatitlanensis TaxID=128782 RepID=A0ABW0F574_9HYPH|nr:hypothetical protein [Bosea minatitlanensis]MCT4493956.1 hypothetical protein [Bosea minatitlanensis]
MIIQIDTRTAILRATQSSRSEGIRCDFDPDLLHYANRNAFDVQSAEPIAFMRDLFAKNEIVFAIVPHAEEPGAFTTDVLQGAKTIARAMSLNPASDEGIDVQVTAWHCSDAAEAMRIRAAFSTDTRLDRERMLKKRKKRSFRLSSPSGRLPVPAEWRGRLEQANRNLEAMKRAIASGVDQRDWYRDLFAPAGVVFLIYHDSDEPYGFGYIVAKGMPLMARAIREGGSLSCATTSMVVASREQAQMIFRDVGDFDEVFGSKGVGSPSGAAGSSRLH